MDKADHTRLTPEAIARIEHARKQLHGILEFAEFKQHVNERSPTGGGIGIAEYAALLGAHQTAEKYFSVMAYEYFLIVSLANVFEEDLVRVAGIAAEEFRSDPDVLTGMHQRWLVRVAGRDAIETTESERAPPNFWEDLSREFTELDAADVNAETDEAGCWKLSGGPVDDREKSAISIRLRYLAWRAVLVLGGRSECRSRCLVRCRRRDKPAVFAEN